MRILIVGAGAIGGYFGGRLLQAGADVTFLVRANRVAQLAKTGLVIKSPFGDAKLNAPTVLADAIREPFDLIVVSCKAYDLEGAMDSFAPAVGPQSAVLPLLNGMRHLDMLDDRFGAGTALGGECEIVATLDADGQILHVNNTHSLTFGERSGGRTSRIEAIAKAMTGANLEAILSDNIVLEMWEKWVFLATLASAACLMRATIGDIVGSGSRNLILGILEECRATADRHGFAPRPAFMDRIRGVLTAAGSPLMPSMLRDVERGARTEADHILGDLVRRKGPGDGRSLLELAYANLRAYEARRLRQSAPK
ncbi:MAG: 2-dehydropantoate 2-reductase [Candidatus Binataceae bacterium]